MANFTISTPANQDARIQAAFGHILGLGRDATGAEVKGAIVAFLINSVKGDETDVAYRASVAAQTPITPT